MSLKFFKALCFSLLCVQAFSLTVNGQGNTLRVQNVSGQVLLDISSKSLLSITGDDYFISFHSEREQKIPLSKVRKISFVRPSAALAYQAYQQEPLKLTLKQGNAIMSMTLTNAGPLELQVFNIEGKKEYNKTIEFQNKGPFSASISLSELGIGHFTMILVQSGKTIASANGIKK